MDNPFLHEPNLKKKPSDYRLPVAERIKRYLDTLPVKIKRPPAKYDNKSHDQIIDEWINKNI